VTLADARDALGMPRARVNWRLGDAVKRTFDRTLALIGQELREGGIADVALDEPLAGREWPAQLEGTWHHMGTTRMHDSPRQGVVDRHGRVHELGNLYIAGSSVFPTAGANFPTFTLVALALRLADHLKHLQTLPGAVVTTGTDALRHSAQPAPAPARDAETTGA